MYDPRKRKNQPAASKRKVVSGRPVIVRQSRTPEQRLRRGCAFWVIALFMCCFLTAVPASIMQFAPVASLRNVLFCGLNGETFVQEPTLQEDGSYSFSSEAVCRNTARETERDASNTVALVALGGVCIPCLLGLFPMIAGLGGLWVKRTFGHIEKTMQEFITSNAPIETKPDDRIYWAGKEVTATEAAYMLEEAIQQRFGPPPMVDDRETRLRKLKKSLEAGWISQAEYDQFYEKISDEPEQGNDGNKGGDSYDGGDGGDSYDGGDDSPEID